MKKMNSVNKTLYIPLYGKSFVSKKGLFIRDKKAEEIWKAEGFKLKGKSKSKWLAYYMGIRSAVFDEWARAQIASLNDAVVIHIGCGLDSRAVRIGADNIKWYDVDFATVIEERKKYFSESDNYKMIASDARNSDWLTAIEENNCAIVIMEGVSMYLTPKQMQALTQSLVNHFKSVALLVDCYSVLAAKMSKIKNPINDVGVTSVYGIDDPKQFECGGLAFLKEHNITPEKHINELKGFERAVFSRLYAGGFSKKLYRLFEYHSINTD